MSRPFIFGFLVLVALVAGGGLIAAAAYQAGIAAGAAGSASTAVPIHYWAGFGWHPFGWLFGLFGFLLFLFLVFALLRLAFGRGRWGGWNGDDGGPGSAVWERRGRDRFDAWHAEAHGERRVAPDVATDRPAGPTPG